MTTISPTSALPVELVDGLGHFTVFKNAEDAIRVAAQGNAKAKREGEADEARYEAFERADGRFLVARIEEDFAFYIPAEMVEPAGAISIAC